MKRAKGCYEAQVAGAAFACSCGTQQKDARRASDVLTRSVLKFAAAKGFDAVALNEVFHDEQALLARAPRLRARIAPPRRLGSRLGLISTVPLRAQPVRHMLGYGALCARPIPPGSRTDGGGGSGRGRRP